MILSILVEVHYLRSRGGGILWRPPSRTACFYSMFI